MEDIRNEQVEALEVLKEFNERLLKNMNIIIKELSGERLEDTDKFLNSIIDAINWEVQVVNGTISLLNEEKERINTAQFNEKILTLGDAVASKEDDKIAAAIRDLIVQFENLGEAAAEVTA